MPDSIKKTEERLKSLPEAIQIREQWERRNLRTVITNGCFDLLHRGHASYLKSAAELGDRLIVLINSDRAVRALKGPTRPVNREQDRAYLLASLRCVDLVVVFDGMRCAEELELLRPDVYVKGGDYTVDTLNTEERAALERAGSEIAFLPFVDGYSTTETLKRAGGSLS